MLSCTITKLWPIIQQIFASDRGGPHFNGIAGGDPLQISPLWACNSCPGTAAHCCRKFETKHNCCFTVTSVAALNARGLVKYSDFGRVEGYVSEMVQERR